jgi:hypothetical protein
MKVVICTTYVGCSNQKNVLRECKEVKRNAKEHHGENIMCVLMDCCFSVSELLKALLKMYSLATVKPTSGENHRRCPRDPTASG